LPFRLLSNKGSSNPVVAMNLSLILGILEDEEKSMVTEQELCTQKHCSTLFYSFGDDTNVCTSIWNSTKIMILGIFQIIPLWASLIIEQYSSLKVWQFDTHVKMWTINVVHNELNEQCIMNGHCYFDIIIF